MIGSHDTMTYLPAKQWYLKPFKWMAKCQSKSIEEQFNVYGIRLFDFRIKFDKHDKPWFAHGWLKFKGDVYEYLDKLNTMAGTVDGPVYARILLESNGKMKNQEEQEQLFIEFCKHVQKTYNNLTFFSARRKYDWKIIYDFGPEPELNDKYSSTTNIFGGNKEHWTAKIDDFWPWLYAKLNNKKNIAKQDENSILFIDFVNIQ